MLKPLLAVLLLLSCVAPAGSYAWPDKPLRAIVAFPPGGMIDVFARIFQARLVEGLGQPVVIDDRPGAGGTLAEALVAKSAPDGYTMLLSADSPPVNAHLYRKLDYELFRDLEPVSLLLRMPLVLVVHPTIPAESLADLVAHARSRSTPLSYATTGSGTSNHVSMEVLKRLAGIDMTHVPYKGGPQVINDLVGGQVNSSLIALMLAATHVRSGKIRAIALNGENRSPLLPEVQTFCPGRLCQLPDGAMVRPLAACRHAARVDAAHAYRIRQGRAHCGGAGPSLGARRRDGRQRAEGIRVLRACGARAHRRGRA